MNKNIIKTLLLLLLFAIAAFICFNYFTNKESSNQTNTNTPENKINQITQADAEETVKRIMDLYYNEVFYGNYALYCGDVDNKDILNVEVIAGEYAASKTYKDLNSLKAHLSSYLSNELVNKYTKYSDKSVDNDFFKNSTKEYIESDGKLYCHRPARGYNKFSSATYEITTYNQNEIHFNSKVTSHFAVDTISNEGTGTISLIDGQWLLSEYNDSYINPSNNTGN